MYVCDSDSMGECTRVQPPNLFRNRVIKAHTTVKLIELAQWAHELTNKKKIEVSLAICESG